MKAECFLRFLVRLGLITFAGMANGTFAAEAYPNKSIRFVVPFSAGGNTDVLARVIGQKLSAAWGRTGCR